MSTTPMSQPSQPSQPAKSRRTMYAVVGVVVIIVIVVVALFVGGYIGGSTTGKPVSIIDDATCASNSTGCYFSPANVNVTAGGTVTWTNKGTAAGGHTVTNDPTVSSPSFSYDKPLSSQNAVVSVTFPSTAGVYHYYCSIHPWMKGTVTVA